MHTDTSTTYASLFELGQVLFGVAGSLLYHDPTSPVIDELIAERDTLLDPTLQALLPTGSMALYDALAGLADLTVQRSLLLQDFTALFIQRTTSKVYPWESVYTTHDHTLFGPSALEVQSIYDSFDISLGASAHEPLDHIGLELMFLSILSQKGIDALTQEEETHMGGALPRALSQGDEAARLAQTIHDFLAQHILVFAFDFLDTLESKAQTGYYHAVCTFTRETLSWAQQAFSR